MTFKFSATYCVNIFKKQLHHSTFNSHRRIKLEC